MRKEGLRKSDTTSRSRILERIGKIDIGRISERTSGEGILGIGCMTAMFHCAGIVELAIDRFYRPPSNQKKISTHYKGDFGSRLFTSNFKASILQ